MGLGDFEYKVEWTEPEPVFHSVIALTARGRIAARLLEQRAAIKRVIKQTPALWSAARALRRQLLRFRGRP
jgi:CelD/BcsL family acetyltransferase involved in cellulose biosynthesis